MFNKTIAITAFTSLMILSSIASANDFSDARLWIKSNLINPEKATVENCVSSSKTNNVSNCRVHYNRSSEIDVYDLVCTNGFGCVKTGGYTKVL